MSAAAVVARWPLNGRWSLCAASCWETDSVTGFYSVQFNSEELTAVCTLLTQGFIQNNEAYSNISAHWEKEQVYRHAANSCRLVLPLGSHLGIVCGQVFRVPVDMKQKTSRTLPSVITRTKLLCSPVQLSSCGGWSPGLSSRCLRLFWETQWTLLCYLEQLDYLFNLTGLQVSPQATSSDKDTQLEKNLVFFLLSIAPVVSFICTKAGETDSDSWTNRLTFSWPAVTLWRLSVPLIYLSSVVFQIFYSWTERPPLESSC